MAQREKLDFKRIAELALGQVRELLEEWLPGGKYEGSEYVVKNPTRADDKPGSFSISVASGAWSDFAAGDKGGDLIALFAYLNRVSQLEAARTLARRFGITSGDSPAGGASGVREAPPRRTPAPASDEFRPVFPVPDSALKGRPAKAPKLGAPSAVWAYLDSDSRPLMYVFRFDVQAGTSREKTYRPLCFGTDAKGTGWRWKQPAAMRPLYRLERLAASPAGAPVLLCEGEKSTDAARELFPGFVVMTWPAGSKAIGKADFSPLAGRAVRYWHDNDAAGRDSVAPLRDALQRVRANSLAVLDVSLFGQYRPASSRRRPAVDLELVPLEERQLQWPEKADAADALAAGWTAAHVDLLIARGLFAEGAGGGMVAPRPSAPAGEQEGAGGTRCTDTALEYFDLKQERWRPIGGPLAVLGRTRNEEGRSWGVLVSFRDFDGQQKEWNISSQLFAADGGVEVARGLMDRGYPLRAGSTVRRHLIDYLLTHKTRDRVRLVARNGWYKGAYLMPGHTFGDAGEKVYYYNDGPTLCKAAQQGTLEAWTANVGALAVHSTRLTFAVSSAFTGPLLDIVGSETCGFHFYGPSSLGKSTLVNIAGSVPGPPDKYGRQWRLTDNHLEPLSAAHSDGLLILDEIAQIDPRIVGATVYMIGNGEGKGRGTETGGARAVNHTWRIVVLSTGEETLIDLMARVGMAPKAGMEMRLLTLPANVHSDPAQQERLGIFETVGDFAGGAELGRHLLEHAKANHGHPLIAMLNHLTARPREEVAQWVRRRIERFIETAGEGAAGGQSKRAADKFALVAAAGELATELGITGWPKGWATKAAVSCYQAWLEFRGGPGSLEDKRALEHVHLMFIRYGESRFARWKGGGAKVDTHAPRTMDSWGWRKTEEVKDWSNGKEEVLTETTYFVLKPGFAELCKGHDPARVARLLHDAGALEVSGSSKSEGRLQKKWRVPGHGKKFVWVYVIRPSALAMGDDAPPDDDGYHDDIADALQ